MPAQGLLFGRRTRPHMHERASRRCRALPAGVIVLTAWAVYVEPDLSTLVVDPGLTGLPDVVGIDTVRIVIPRLKVPLNLQEPAACATT
jgi:hypothetical protein